MSGYLTLYLILFALSEVDMKRNETDAFIFTSLLFVLFQVSNKI